MPSIFNQKKRSPNKFLKFFEHPFSDFYHWLLVITWTSFLLFIVLFYLAVNIIFAYAYLTTKDGIANADPDSFSDAFFFSIQSMSTIGYGAMYPQTIYAQVLVTVEVLVGLILVAMATGLIFARFAQPSARVMFSKVAVICPFNGVPTLMFRVANQRDNRIIEARLKVSLLKNQISSEGIELRRFYNLELLRSESPSFRLSWLVMHPIDELSPLYKETADSLIDLDLEIIVILTGLDETFSQTIHARHAYQPQDLRWGMRFVDILNKTDQCTYTVDYRRFNEVVPASDRQYK
ncbi:ion channel [Myxosarcina sp. GI1]|uniref:ion channel n=1 Tax=Myxosarcina sp. GI1 TaxID=1541065 RepID=UPI000A40A9F9|nr:ion channel [Myxosarcina sp. GI1]